MQRELRKTEDGSYTLYNSELQETYHSIYGAVQESIHVFIDAGLKHIKSKSICVFELGFGTGLNALLTYQHAIENSIKINYQSIEKYPLDEKIFTKLEYHNFLKDPSLEDVFLKMHQSDWNTAVSMNDYFMLHKIKADASGYNYDVNRADLIYFDAFAPEKQPQLWNEAMFKKMYQIMNPGGILTTYSAKGNVRRAMKKAGFTVEKLPGPPGKWEMLRGLSY